MSSESDALQNRLRAMTVAQLRARWKRIEQHLRDPERVLGSALAARCLNEDQVDPQFAALTDYSQLHAELRDRQQPRDADDEAEYEDQRYCQELGRRAVIQLLSKENDDELARSLLASLGVDERLSRARELRQQMALVLHELSQRGEASPDQDPPLLLISRESEVAGAALGNKVKEGTRAVIEKVGVNAERLSESAEKAGRGISERIAEATRSVANSAAQASGQALWSAATSAFRYGTRGPEKTPIPVKRAPRRPSRSDAPSSDDALSLIERLFELKERGILSEDEFLAKKRELLERL